jgi:hypothetical protein
VRREKRVGGGGMKKHTDLVSLRLLLPGLGHGCRERLLAAG